ncbi:hypothetical protein [Allosphingosinicella indica]|uniref:Uncharacterized protein n=1 Tax=Allosphingosinicella indica TaxID=941907 RepID=A0A1X7GD20_9SPHN|nr:hypothetical protein [Allosphingosinicella indica]SMF67960.1 hypothetical protein SAMN06295910_1578 [Allosphingosinicella indica]
MPVWKYIWLRPLILATVTVVVITTSVWISGSSNAATFAEAGRRAAIGFVFMYILLVICAAAEWRWCAKPLKADDEPK